jgi:hypothetical protein
MSQASGKVQGIMKRRTLLRPIEVAQADWYHDGILHRVRLSGADEVVVFEWQPEGFWEPFVPNPASDTFVSAAIDIQDEPWREFVRQLPVNWQDFLGWFQFNRLEALAVLSQCPQLMPHLERVPALMMFVATHATLRSPNTTHWAEINAIYERENIYGVLSWLGLPSSPHTLAILSDHPEPEVPRSELAIIRSALWNTHHHPLAA